MEIRNASNSYGSRTVPHRTNSNGVLCVCCVLSVCLVDLHVRFHHDVILQEFELSSLLSSYNIYVFGLVMPNELLFLRHNGTTYYVILVCSNKQNSTGFYDHFIH